MSTKQIKATNGQTYNVILNKETELKMDLESHTATLLWNQMKDQQPKRFKQMLKDKTLIPLLNRRAARYDEQMRRAIVEDGMKEYEAKELYWGELISAIGF